MKNLKRCRTEFGMTGKLAALVLGAVLMAFPFASCNTDASGNGDDPNNTPTSYTVTIATGIENGTVTASPAREAAGETITLTVTPNSGYELDTLTVKDAGNADVTTTEVTEGESYTFTMPKSNVTVSATFSALSPAISLSCETATVWKGDKITGTVVFSNFETTPEAVGLYAEGQELPVISNATVTDGKFKVNTTNLNAGTHKVYVKSESVESNHISITINEIPEGFKKVTGTTFDGTSTLTPASKVFISGRSITIGDLWVSDHEVTQKEYATYCKFDSTNKPSANYGVGDNYPAYFVSWYDAVVYCNLRSIDEGLTPAYALSGETDPSKWTAIVSEETDGVTKYCGPSSKNDTWNGMTFNTTANGYRLPTEAEWEYIAREANTSSTTYSGSDTIGDVAWYDSNAGNKTHEIKTKTANSLDIYDMSGNVREWCWDWYIYSINDGTPASGASSGSYRVLRGGGWSSSLDTYCEVAYRGNGNPSDSNPDVGFRLVRSAQ